MKNLIEKIKTIVVNHKKICVIMLILFAIILICVFCFGDNNSESREKTLEEKLRTEIEAVVTVDILLDYDASNVTPKIATLRKNREDLWEVYGKVTARDKYGDNFSGTFEGICEVEDEEKELFDCDIEYSKMYRN